MTVDSNQIKAMGDIIARLNSLGADAFEPGSGALPPPAPTLTENYAKAHDPVDGAKAGAMGDILSRFRTATQELREDALTNDDLLEALQTERTDHGVRIAEWEINVREEPNIPGKFYDVIRDEITIASDLRLYEAALILTRELNKGKSITSEKVMSVLALEAQYAKNFDDAINYSRIFKLTEGTKKDVAAARLDEAKAKALDAKRKIKDFR